MPIKMPYYLPEYTCISKELEMEAEEMLKTEESFFLADCAVLPAACPIHGSEQTVLCP